MGIDILIGSLVADGAAEAERIREAARAEGERLVADAEARGAAEVEAARDAAEAELRTHVAEAIFAARRDGRRKVLLAREQALDAVCEAARRRLEGAHDEPRVRDVLPGIVANAAGYLPREGLIARCHPALREVVSAALAGLGTPRVETDPAVPPGVVLHDGMGCTCVEETLPGRLDRMWPTLRMGVTKAIEEAG